MVQIIQSHDPRKRLADMFGMELGKGLSQGINTYLANKSLDNVLNDPSLKDASSSERMSAIQRALAPHAEYGENIIKQRMQIEQQAMQENQMKAAQVKEKKKGQGIAKLQKGEQLTPDEWSVYTPQETAALQRAFNPKPPTQPISTQPIRPEQLSAIDKAHSQPGYEDMNESQKYNTLIHNGVSPENADREASLFNKQAEREQKGIETAYKSQENYINDTTKSYRSFETETKPKLLQLQQVNSDEDLIGPGTAQIMNELGLPLGLLENPSNELYEKVSQDLMKGIPEVYGNRIMKIEVDNFLKTIPRLMNSANGRRMVATNMLKLGEMREIMYNEMRRQQKDSIDNNKPLPRDFEQRIFDQVKPQIDKFNDEFVKLSQITDIPKGEVPFFDPEGQIKFIPKNQIEWASKHGGKRIW